MNLHKVTQEKKDGNTYNNTCLIISEFKKDYINFSSAFTCIVMIT